jgi:predicted NBD/HSP70 family sugar kinase
MYTLGLIRRVVIALLAAAACQNALAQSGLPIHNIQVDVAPLRANAGDQTASWVQQRLPDQLAHALAGRVTAHGGTLVVRIDYVTLGPIKDSSAWDNISGVAMIGGVQWPLRATARYQASAIDQVMFEESNHRRVTQLVQALTYWLARDL